MKLQTDLPKSVNVITKDQNGQLFLEKCHEKATFINMIIATIREKKPMITILELVV